jgi:uncharacterized protein DUF6884
MDAIVVPCTHEKIWDDQPDAGSVEARDAYTKPAFLAWRQYAEASGSPWFILSTKYGLIRPDTRIERYNVPVAEAAGDASFLRLLEKQGRELGLDTFERIVLLDWEKFEPLVRAAAPNPHVKCVLRKVKY